MTNAIVALIHGAPGNYGVSFPDAPGCVTAADSLDQALAMAEEALAFHLAGMTEDGVAMPVPRTLDAILADPVHQPEVSEPHIVALVPFNPPGRSVRVNITMDERLLDAVDRAAKDEGGNRSGFLARAARVRLGLR